MVLAVHADVDDPFVVVEAFSDVSAHAKIFGPIQVVHETVDVEGCAAQKCLFRVPTHMLMGVPRDLLFQALDIRCIRTLQSYSDVCVSNVSVL